MVRCPPPRRLAITLYLVSRANGSNLPSASTRRLCLSSTVSMFPCAASSYVRAVRSTFACGFSYVTCHATYVSASWGWSSTSQFSFSVSLRYLGSRRCTVCANTTLQQWVPHGVCSMPLKCAPTSRRFRRKGGGRLLTCLRSKGEVGVHNSPL